MRAVPHSGRAGWARCGWITAALAIGVAVSGCSSTNRVGSGSTTELEALYRARRDSARMQFTDADVQFMKGMIAHHAQALVMSRLAPTHGASSEVQTLAARIINAQ